METQLREAAILPAGLADADGSRDVKNSQIHELHELLAAETSIEASALFRACSQTIPTEASDFVAEIQEKERPVVCSVYTSPQETLTVIDHIVGPRNSSESGYVTDTPYDADFVDEFIYILNQPEFKKEHSADQSTYPDLYGTPLDFDDGTRLPLFDGEPDRDQISQGALGDCGIIATLGAVAARYPEVIRDCISERDDGTYLVRLHDTEYHEESDEWRPTGRFINLVVDSQLPVRADEPGKPAFANGHCAWGPILEKAIASLDQTWSEERRDSLEDGTGYLQLHGAGHARWAELLTQLTGRPARCFTLDQDDPECQEIIDFLGQKISENEPVLISTRPTEEDEEPLPFGLLDAHAYEVVHIDSEDMVELHNPWNYRHPKEVTIFELMGKDLNESSCIHNNYVTLCDDVEEDSHP